MDENPTPNKRKSDPSPADAMSPSSGSPYNTFPPEYNPALLAAIVGTSEDAIISRTLEGVITSWNAAAGRMFGYRAEEAIGKHISILIPENRLDEESKILENIIKGDRVDHLETIRIARDGSRIPISLSVSPILDPTGKVVGASKIARNIMDRRVAEEKQAFLASIVATSDDAIISKTLDGMVTSWNIAAEKLFGYTPAEVIGKHISLLIPSDRLAEEDVIIGNIVQGKQMDHFETIRQAKNGRQIPISLTVSPIVNSKGEIIGASKIARDISSQLEAKKIQEKLYAEVKALNEKKDEFIGIASHELKTPLTSISGYLQILKRLKTDGQIQNFLDKTILQVNKLAALVSDMLDVSKIEAGKLQLSKTSFDIRPVIDNVIELIEHTHAGSDILLDTIPGSYLAYGDPQRIEQVLINLLTNAIKYSPVGSPIRLWAKADSRGLTIAVRDQGYGISADKLDLIFSRFYRVEEANPNISGLGIGLYISREIAEQHKGRLWAESEPGKGSTFFFFLPHNEVK